MSLRTNLGFDQILYFVEIEFTYHEVCLFFYGYHWSHNKFLVAWYFKVFSKLNAYNDHKHIDGDMIKRKERKERRNNSRVSHRLSLT